MLKRLEPVQTSAQDSRSEFDFRAAIRFAWRRWRLIAGTVGLFLIIATVYLVRETPLYTATAALLLDPQKVKVGQEAVITDSELNLPAIENQIAIISSSELLRRVVEKERLVNDPEFGVVSRPEAKPGLFASIFDLFQRPSHDNKGDKPASMATPLSMETIASVEKFKGALSVARMGQAYVIAVSVSSADPAKAARLTNAVANAYVVDKLDARFEAAKRASAWLSDRLVELRQQLRQSEEAVASFRSENNLSGVSSTGVSLNQEQLGQLNGRLVQARAEAAEKKARLEMLQKIEARGGSITALPDIMNNGALADLRKQATDLSRQEADLLARYSGNHPSVVNIRAQLSDVTRGIHDEIRRLSATVHNEYDLAKARQDAVERTLREVTGATDLDNAKAITLRELERTAAVNKSLFEDFLQRARVTQEQSTFEARDARVITPALSPGTPSKPKKALVIMVALVLGLIAGVGGAFLVEMLNAGFTTPRQIEEMLDLPLLASISKYDKRNLTIDGVVLTLPEYTLARPLCRLSESIRALRSSIQMSDVDQPPKVLQFTSTLPREGKSTLTLAVASSAAQSGLRVLVVDADMRHPSTSHFFKAEKKMGLVEYLARGADRESVILYSERLRVWYMAAGGKTQNPTDLLESDRMKALIADLRSQFDLVIIDTPPIGPVIDPLIVSQLVDKVIYVVQWASTARELIAPSIKRLSGYKKVAGVVFNLVIDEQAQKYNEYLYPGADYNRYYTE